MINYITLIKIENTIEKKKTKQKRKHYFTYKIYIILYYKMIILHFSMHRLQPVTPIFEACE